MLRDTNSHKESINLPYTIYIATLLSRLLKALDKPRRRLNNLSRLSPVSEYCWMSEAKRSSSVLTKLTTVVEKETVN